MGSPGCHIVHTQYKSKSNTPHDHEPPIDSLGPSPPHPTHSAVQRDTTKYLSINGCDREWTVEPTCFKYTVKTASGTMPTNSNNVVSLQATCLLLPMEIPLGQLRDTRETFL
jgi:hypothetical protein